MFGLKFIFQMSRALLEVLNVGVNALLWLRFSGWSAIAVVYNTRFRAIFGK